YLEEMSASVTGRMHSLQMDIYRYAAEEFNLNSPPQLRQILYEKLGLSPGKKTPKGQLSTDASVLEKLRDQHPIVDALLQWRELDKLNSTYLVALPKLMNPATGRVHTTFNQAVATTGRLSSTNPNLQNIPSRGEAGRGRGVHRDAAGAAAVHPRAASRQSAGARPGTANGAQRPHPGRGVGRLQAGDDPGRPGAGRAGRAGVPHAAHGARRAGLRGA